jgi:hypothetical protein
MEQSVVQNFAVDRDGEGGVVGAEVLPGRHDAEPVVGASRARYVVGGVASLAVDVELRFHVVRFEYVGASADVLEANDMEPEFDIDCEGSDATNDVTCTGSTDDGLDIVSTGENLGADDATLTVTVDGEVLYDGLLDETP